MKHFHSILFTSALLGISFTSTGQAASRDLPPLSTPVAVDLNIIQSEPEQEHYEHVCDPSISKDEAKWCAGGFQAGCKDLGGGLSSNPDGTISCTTTH